MIMPALSPRIKCTKRVREREILSDYHFPVPHTNRTLISYHRLATHSDGESQT